MGDPVREEAADLLACLASQPGGDVGDHRRWYTTRDLPGDWQRRARTLARETFCDAADGFLNWRERYAEAEARLREVSRG